MYDKLFKLSPFLFHPNKRMEEEREKEVAIYIFDSDLV